LLTAIGHTVGGLLVGAVATFLVGGVLYFPFALWERLTLRTWSPGADPRRWSAMAAAVVRSSVAFAVVGFEFTPFVLGWILGAIATVRVMRWIIAGEANEEQRRRDVEEVRLQGQRRERVPQRVKDEVWRRDQGRCAECGSRVRLEFHHIVPVSRGGSNTARNIELLCEACHRPLGARIG
jgi:hypothetical protein